MQRAYGVVIPSREHRLPQPLRPYVRSCVGYDYRLDPKAVHHGVPSTTLTLIIAFDEPLDCGWLEPRADGVGRQRFTTLVAGLHTNPSLIRTHGRQHGIQLGLTPAGCRALLGAPAAAFADYLVTGADVGFLSADLHERMQEATWPVRFRLLEEHLAARLQPTAIRPEVAYAWQRLTHGSAEVRVTDLAREVGLSRRRLLTEFSAEIGLTPTQVRRVARFDRARALLRSGLRLAEVAARTGYADQSHLTREWRSLSGMTPVESLDDFPVVQDPPT